MGPVYGAQNVWALRRRETAQQRLGGAAAAVRELGLTALCAETAGADLECGRQSRPLLPGILRCQRASEAFREAIYEQHRDGINRSQLGRREGIGAPISSAISSIG